jgi:hypothetical protein
MRTQLGLRCAPEGALLSFACDRARVRFCPHFELQNFFTVAMPHMCEKK